MKFILLGFTIYFAYRFISGFLIPVARTTRQVKKQFDAMREQQQYQQPFSSPHQTTSTAQQKQKKNADDDYLEFEEIK
ncbi:MAG: hypothetical protein RL131_283 [Bacteroidota bacterium]